MKDSQIVLALAEIASKGKYEVLPEGARQLTAVFEMVAGLVNRLEAREKADEEATDE